MVAIRKKKSRQAHKAKISSAGMKHPVHGIKKEVVASEITGDKKIEDPDYLIELLTKENKLLKKRLIEAKIRAATLESLIEEEKSYDHELDQMSPAELEKQKQQLENQLKYEHMRAEAYDTMIDIAEEELGIGIRKEPSDKK